MIKSGCQFLLPDNSTTNGTKHSTGIKGRGGCWEVNGCLYCSRGYHRKKTTEWYMKGERICCTMLNLFKNYIYFFFHSQPLLLWSVSSIESKVSELLSINMHNNRFNTYKPLCDKIKASTYFLFLLLLCFLLVLRATAAGHRTKLMRFFKYHLVKSRQWWSHYFVNARDAQYSTTVISMAPLNANDHWRMMGWRWNCQRGFFFYPSSSS